jgi:hypothetical protein
MPKFSIIAVDYEFHVPRPGMRAGLDSLAAQHFDDFEIVYVHDGPKGAPLEHEYDLSKFKHPVKILNTPEHMGHWGHYSRDFGMRNASGEYFLHFNIDNVLYPEALQVISDTLDNHPGNMVIFAVRHFKAAAGQIFSGLPPTHCHIDAMQLIASKSVWENAGYWYTYEGTSDGIIYEKICAENPYVHIPQCLGENY